MSAHAYPFEVATARRSRLGIHPEMVLNHTIAIDGGDQRRKDSASGAYRLVTGLPVPDTYRKRYARWAALTDRLDALAMPGFCRFTATLKGRMIVGMGDASIHENSITLTWIDGVPTIPGSALKGLVVAVARDRAVRVTGDRPLTLKERRVIGGTVENASYFTFHDAWYVPDGNAHPLRLDVMTPHHQKYNASRGASAAPDDSEDPIPIEFLVTTGTFLFALQGPDARWTQLVRDLLTFGLQHHGVGAKTSSDYGRFHPPAPALPNAFEEHETLAAIRALTATAYRREAEDLATTIVDLPDDVRPIVARAFGQRTRDLGTSGWLREQPWWELVSDELSEAVGLP